jgi:environmental stress-induced protein Ves
MPALARSRVVPANEYRRERWRNGLGWTREIHASPGTGGEAWSWRLSIAEIERDAPFSAFPGVDRELVLLSGNGLRLRFDDGDDVLLDPPHGRLRFAGERAVTGVLVDGPTQDFNLMWHRDRVDAQLWHRPLVGPMVIFAEPATTWAVHLIAGQARFADDSGLPPLAAGDTALLEAGGERLRHVLDGGGETLLVRLQPRDAGEASGRG